MANKFLARNIFFVEGRGVIAAGEVEEGVIKAGMRCDNYEDKEVVIKSVEAYNKSIDSATAGQIVGILLSGLKSKSEIESGTQLIFF